MGAYDAVDEKAPFAQRLVASVRDAQRWPDALDDELLLATSAWPREWAEHTLIRFLPRDGRDARSLARLRSLRAVRPLREALAVANGPPRLMLAAALPLLDDDGGAVATVVDAVAGRDRPLRLAAFRALTLLPNESAREAFRAAASDSDPARWRAGP